MGRGEGNGKGRGEREGERGRGSCNPPDHIGFEFFFLRFFLLLLISVIMRPVLVFPVCSSVRLPLLPRRRPSSLTYLFIYLFAPLTLSFGERLPWVGASAGTA